MNEIMNIKSVMVALVRLLPDVHMPEEPTRRLRGTVYKVTQQSLTLLVRGARPEILTIVNHDDVGGHVQFYLDMVGREIEVLARGDEVIGPLSTLTGKERS